MIQSDNIAELVKALLSAKKDIHHASKDAKNMHLGNKYATLEAVLDAVTEPLAKNGLVIVQAPTFLDGHKVIATTLYHSSGQFIRSFTEIIFDANKNPAQAQGSGITYARRYALAAMCGIGQEDDDGNAAGTAKPKPQAARGTPVIMQTDPGEYVLTFGNNKGKKIRELSEAELRRGIEFFGANPKGAAVLFVENAKAFLAEMGQQ